jgi:uncharacterized coiled-coil DUF342 family protein
MSESEVKLKELKLVKSRLEEKRDEYVQRLDIGAAKIDEGQAQGKDCTLWTDYWIQLLRQYEVVMDKLRDCESELLELQPA